MCSWPVPNWWAVSRDCDKTTTYDDNLMLWNDNGEQGFQTK